MAATTTSAPMPPAARTILATGLRAWFDGFKTLLLSGVRFCGGPADGWSPCRVPVLVGCSLAGTRPADQPENADDDPRDERPRGDVVPGDEAGVRGPAG